MLRFASQVNNFFSFRESFSRRPSVVFLKARGAFMLPFAFEVNNFFPFRETFCFTVEPVVFLQSRGAFMLPFASGVNRFFRFCEISFRLRFREPFSLIARSVYAPPRSTSQPLFASWPNRLAQCVIPVTREEQFKQTLHPCQHKKQISLSDIRKCPAGAIFAQLHARHHHALPLSIPPPTPSLTSAKQGNYISSYGELCLTCRPTLPIFRHTTN